MQFYIDIHNGAGTKYGSGPIVSASYWRSTWNVDRAGPFEFAFPVADAKASIVQKRRYATCYAILDDGPTELGTGIVDRISVRPGLDGNVMLVVAGDNLLRETAWRSVKYLALYSGTSPVTHAAAVTALAALLPAGWSAVAAATPGNNDIYYTYAGESCLAAAIKLAELSRCHVWMSAPRVLTFDTVWPSSGLRAIEAPANPDLADENTCFIEQFECIEDTYDLISRALPYGGEVKGGTAGQIVTLANATKSAPVGYTLSTGSNYIRNDAAETAYGQVEGFMKFNDIEANSTAAGDLESAANQLFDLALRDLQKKSTPAQFYKLRLKHCNSVVTPFQTIRAIFRRVADGRNAINVDATLYIMGATIEVDADSIRTTDLDVASVDRWADNSTTPIAELMRNNLRIN